MRRKMIRKKWLLALVPAVMLFTAGFVARPAAGDDYFEISKNLDIFGKLYREVHANYVDDIEPTDFMRTGIDAMLKSLDPYTNYISAAEIEDYRFMSTGQYGGIGAMVGKRDNKVIVTEPYENSPAVKAGLRAGDVIIQIDNQKVNGDNGKNIDVRDLLRGQPKSKVKLIVEREGSPQPITLELERDDIKILNVPYWGMIDNEIGYISLTGFTADAAKEVKTAFEDLKAKNPGMKSLMLDLRGNPGGLLFEAIDISNLFVPKDELIVETRGKMEGSLKSYTARNNPVDIDIPLAVLVNRRSASASEIVSGVIQDLDRGVIVGQRSYGKGLVQTTRPLSYNSQIKITTAKYYTPSGRCIQAIDYSNRNEDGSVGKIPDSLQKEFKTHNGRKVYDGGGVAPDVEVALPELHTVSKELIRQNMIFDYATHFRVNHESIPTAREFKITDEIYSDFIAFCKGKAFTFETKTEKEFDAFKKVVEEEHYQEELSADMKAMEAKLKKEKEEDLINFRSEITNLLRNEIVMRYYYRKGEIDASFDMDPDVLEAIKVLKDKERMNKILAKG
ncbi:MAG: S41 family peptidase [Bacteroidetes bacterium]|nr:S41 family peptidase [Bacteroidota bacterium]MBL0015226.1 S41 family peptidase [Bacteroidota bacterium]MBP6720917.1 S41 family peptidase [Bacteroidia bacterium]MBP8073191.1 S41 family peptidase [Bacteroidia bacterium]